MDYLRDGIGLRAMAQKDPLIEYQREGYDLFVAMMDGIKEESVGYLFNVEVQVEQPAEPAPQMTGVFAQTQVAPAQEQGEGMAALLAQAGQTGMLETAPKIKAAGLTGHRPDHVEYSAPAEGGGMMHASGTVETEGEIEIDPNASRAERRRAERARRKKR